MLKRKSGETKQVNIGMWTSEQRLLLYKAEKKASEDKRGFYCDNVNRKQIILKCLQLYLAGKVDLFEEV